jgi:signal transduction histidine kinase
LLEQQAATFQHQASQHNICLRVQTGPVLPEIHVDPERMGQVLGNLVSNALRYTPDGGEILLSAHRQTDAVLISVQDNGAGITPEVLPYIFDRFYRGDDSRQGSESGLGLAIAMAIVELHGGKITAQSDGIGRGSLFSISLPNSVII